MAEERHCPEREDKSALSGDQSDIPTNVTPPAGFVPPDPDKLAKQFPQLEILELLGQGGTGAVYKARQKQLDRFMTPAARIAGLFLRQIA